jgi:predicted MPP superfamily phosphohydrolase
VFYVFNYLWQFIFNKNKADETAEAINTSRRQFLNSGILLASSLPGVVITDGVVRGRYNYKVYEEELRFKDLPKAFDGLKIVQISDIHSGSFDSEAGVRRGIELIKAQNADLILFTGDIVNVFADEMEPWISLFSELRAPMGQYSVLGNHDYHSRWVAWKTKEEGIINHDKIIDIHNKIGFKLLNNDHVLFEKEGQKIALLGVENWGKKPFPQIGDIHKTLAPVPNDMFKVLMSHDPSHFDLIISKLETPIHLTLSGHTHGAQFGIESKFLKWSPVQYRYPRWAGLYEENERYLYVNRGFGFLGFPGRVGIRPEITAITLRSLT